MEDITFAAAPMVAEQQVEDQAHQNWLVRHAREMTTAVTLTAVALGATVGSESLAYGANHHKKVVPAEVCAGTHLGENLSNTDVTIPEAFFPQLYTTNKNGQPVLVSHTTATERIRKQVSGDSRALAIVSSIIELRNAKQLPTPGLIDRIKQLSELYVTN